jgi:hypothetical protein
MMQEDAISPMAIYLICGIFVLRGLDAITTWVAVNALGMRELNPFTQSFLGDPVAYALWVVGGTALVVGVIWIMHIIVTTIFPHIPFYMYAYGACMVVCAFPVANNILGLAAHLGYIPYDYPLLVLSEGFWRAVYLVS